MDSIIFPASPIIYFEFLKLTAVEFQLVEFSIEL